MTFVNPCFGGRKRENHISSNMGFERPEERRKIIGGSN
jgi:hypothetical protein